MKIYLVGQGEYSSYRIIGVFNDKKLANKFIKSLNNDDYFNVEEHILNPHKAQLDKNYKPYIVKLDLNGNLLQIEQKYFQWNWQNSGERSPEYDAYNKAFLIPVFAKNQKMAVKIAADVKTQATLKAGLAS